VELEKLIYLPHFAKVNLDKAMWLQLELTLKSKCSMLMDPKSNYKFGILPVNKDLGQ